MKGGIIRPMSAPISRRILLGQLLASAAVPAFANAPERSIRPRARAGDYQKQLVPSAGSLVTQSGLSGKISFAVVDVATGKLLETRNGSLLQPPASVAKTVTAAYALAHLGPAYRFGTRILTTGSTAGGVVTGDLILQGGGDPHLDTDGLADMVKTLKEKGIVSVRGKFRVDGSALPGIDRIDPEQLDHVGYNPAISGVNLNFNRVHFEWRRAQGGYAIKMDARAKRFQPEVTTSRMSIAERSLPIYDYRSDGGVDRWSVARKALGKGGARWLPVRNPDAYVAEVFRTLARAHGIDMPRPIFGAHKGGGTVLVDHPSATAEAMVRSMLKFSTNLTAEVLGLTATQSQGRKPQSLKASGRAMATWAKSRLDLGNARFDDHSGLGEGSRIAADRLALALARLGPNAAPGALMKTIPMRDKNGKVMKTHPIRVRAKTGTLNFVSALAGYAVTPGGKTLAFAIFTSDLDRRRAAKKAGDEVPKGVRAWTKRSKKLQQSLIERWSALYDA